MPKRSKVPTVLCIAGSDSGGGAGIQADLKTFASLGVHGASAITCITAQNPVRVRGVHACEPKMVRQQINAVLERLSPAAIKTGMLFSNEIVCAIAQCLGGHGRRRRPPLVVDPVMMSTSGTRLLEVRAVEGLTRLLLPLATLVTPNLDETAQIVGWKIRSIDEMRSAAREIQFRFGCAALVKGGHLRGGTEAADIFFDGRNELLLSAPFVRGVRLHGTGCTYASAIAAFLALGRELPRAVELAKHYLSGAIAHCVTANGHAVLNHFWRR